MRIQFWLSALFGFMTVYAVPEVQAQVSEKVCCVDFYGQPVGLQTRQECQFNGGDVAAANRCEPPQDVAQPQVGGVALPEEIEPYENQSLLPRQFKASGDVAKKWVLPHLYMRGRDNPKFKQIINDRNQQTQLFVESLAAVSIFNPNSKNANVSIECRHSWIQTSNFEPFYFSQTLRGFELEIVGFWNWDLQGLSDFSCLVDSDVPIAVYAVQNEETYEKNPSKARGGIWRWLDARTVRAPAFRIEVDE